MGGSRFHGFVDVARAHVERAAENARECKHVIDLIGIIAAARADNIRTATLGVLRADFRHGVGMGKTSGRSAMEATISGVTRLGAETPKNTSAPRSASASVPVFCAGLVAPAMAACAGFNPAIPRQRMPHLSHRMMSCTPRERKWRASEMPAAPAPLMTILVCAGVRSVRRRALISAAAATTAVPCWSS